MKTTRFTLGLLLGFCLGALAPAIASTESATTDAVSSEAETPHARVRIVADHSAVAPGQRFQVAFEQHLIPKWHTYWRNPGDSGEPVQLTWTLPEGVTAGEIQWPAPEAIPVGPLMNYGYSERAVFLTELEVPASWPAGEPLALAVHAYWLVCEKECIPEWADLALAVPTAERGEVDPAVAEVVAFARERQAQAFEGTLEYAVGDGTLLLSMPAGALGFDEIDAARFFPSRWGILDHAADQAPTVVDDVLTLRAPLGQAPPTDSIDGVLRVSGTSDGTPLERALVVRAEPGGVGPGSMSADPVSVPGTTGSLVGALLAAFLGGILLNLMPCVFPVLALKAFGLLSHAGDPARARIAGGLAYTTGVLLTFLGLAIALLLARAGGAAVGWGFQLQDPRVIGFLALVTFAVGLNLSGVYVIGTSLSRIDHHAAGRSDWLGSLMTGVLAGVVAAPCTAPFMAAATGFALTRPAGEALAVFGTLGFGMAAPYLLLTLVPGLAERLPRPGAWMERLRQALAFPMYAATAWLIWILAQQVDPDGVGLVLGALLLLGLGAWLWGLGSRPILRLAAVAALLIAFGAPVARLAGSAATGPALATPPGDAAVAYSPEALERYREEGRIVFLNLTAAWCITCKVNERVALETDTFREALEQHDAVYMRGDWTRRDPVITRVLESFERAGVPLYVVYAPGGDHAVLPQVLTPAIAAGAIEAAADGRGAPPASRET